MTPLERSEHIAEWSRLMKARGEVVGAVSAQSGQKKPRRHRATGRDKGRPEGGTRKAARELGVREFMLLRSFPEEDQDRDSWQRTADLLLAAAEGSAQVESATQQLERALFLQAKWLLPED